MLGGKICYVIDKQIQNKTRSVCNDFGAEGKRSLMFTEEAKGPRCHKETPVSMRTSVMLTPLPPVHSKLKTCPKNLTNV